MAKCTISRVCPDDDQLQVVVEESSDAHPDGIMSEVARVALELFDGAHRVMFAEPAAEDESSDG